MNSLERVMRTLRFERTDRVPVIPQIFGHCARFIDADLEQYGRDGATLARAQLAAWEAYRHDVVFAVADVCVESEAAGSRLKFYSGQYPDIAEYALAAPAEVRGRPLPDPRKDGRMEEILVAVRHLHEAVGGKVPVVGCVLGPMSLATQLLGIEQTLYTIADDPAGFEQLLDYAAQISARFGSAQVEAGADVLLVFEPSASPAVITPALFRTAVGPRLAQITAAARRTGVAACWLHIAGPAAPILGEYPDLGFHIANFDYEVDPAQASAALPRTCVDGNIKPLAFVSAAPAEIRDQARALLEHFAPRGGFILSSGCEIPPEAEQDNVRALVESVQTATD